jgi:hypothetical protein
VEEAIRRAEEPSARAWDPKNGTFGSHIGSFANSLIANAWRKKERATTSSVDPSDLASVQHHADTPEEAFARAEHRARKAKMLALLRDELGHVPCCKALLDGLHEGDDKPHKRALALGFSHDDIEIARRRISRHGANILEQELARRREGGKVR